MSKALATISYQVEGMEEEEQDQEVPEAPSPVEEDEVVEEADNEEEVVNIEV